MQWKCPPLLCVAFVCILASTTYGAGAPNALSITVDENCNGTVTSSFSVMSIGGGTFTLPCSSQADTYSGGLPTITHDLSAFMTASPAAAQLRSGQAGETKVEVAITIQAAGQPYSFQGKAECHYAPVASIYNVVAEMWSVQQSDGQRSITLTLWRPRSTSGDMFSLSVARGGKSYVVNTVNAGGKSAVEGSGKVTFTKSGRGGTFTINATAANGAAITGKVNCSGFTTPIAEAGD